MKQWLAMIAAVVFLALPVLVSAGEETVIPPEANWTPTPEFTGGSSKRVVSVESEQASDLLRPAAVRRNPVPHALTEEDATYQAVNKTVHDD
ncbi:MAG: hypothetical protein ACRERE_01115 [Candidatus Entotheonellia bacterium]